eukprot:12883388-Prorocentrum_lima.AAC.1
MACLWCDVTGGAVLSCGAMFDAVLMAWFMVWHAWVWFGVRGRLQCGVKCGVVWLHVARCSACCDMLGGAV